MPTPDIDDRLADKGLTLPPAPAPVAAYLPVVRAGSLAFVSGQIPMRDGALIARGGVPDPVSLEQARECARQCVLNALAALRAELGGFGPLRRAVKLEGFVACPPGFDAQPKVIDAASELLIELMGDAGRHARAAVGVPALPLDAPVEIAFTFELDSA